MTEGVFGSDLGQYCFSILGVGFSILSVYCQYVGASGEHGGRMYVGLSEDWG